MKQLRMQLYRGLARKQGQIYSEIEKIPQQIRIPDELKGKLSLYRGSSGCPPPIRREALEAILEVEKTVHPNKYLAEELRVLVKETYGDEYDAVGTSTCEAALWIIFDTLCSPSMGKGDAYQTCYIAPYERHMHHQGAYGRPFPPKYKDFITDHGVTAGETGMLGKRQNNLSTVIVPLEGAKYGCHGIKYYPTPLLTKVNPDKSYEKIANVAARHSSSLVGITSLGYETPGYGYGDKDADGTPKLQKLLSQIAREYNIPYLADNAAGAPIIGNDIRKIGADIMVYTTDKCMRAPIGGLIIGKEEIMVPLRRALGMHSTRSGGLAYGKADYVGYDPGRTSLAGIIAMLKVLRENPETFTKAVDTTYEIVLEEIKNNVDPEISKHFIVTKSYNWLAVEINYENTWSEDRIGFPIFPVEDVYAGTNMIGVGLEKAGIIQGLLSYAGNIMVGPGHGTADENGQLIEKNMRYVVRTLFKVMEVIAKFWNRD